MLTYFLRCMRAFSALASIRAQTCRGSAPDLAAAWRSWLSASARLKGSWHRFRSRAGRGFGRGKGEGQRRRPCPAGGQAPVGEHGIATGVRIRQWIIVAEGLQGATTSAGDAVTGTSTKTFRWRGKRINVKLLAKEVGVSQDRVRAAIQQLKR